MSKRIFVRGPALTNSGYGEHTRQIIGALANMGIQCSKPGLLEVGLQPVRWGETDWDSYIDKDKNFSAEKTFLLSLTSKLNTWAQAKMQPDISMVVSVPNEFEKMAPTAIGISAVIECDRVVPSWLQKANQMDLMIVPSEFSKSIMMNTKYQGSDGSTLSCNVPIEVIPESVDTSIFNDQLNDKDLDIDLPPFCFITVGQWGTVGADRKNIEGTIQVFKEAFKDHPDKEKIGLVLKVNCISNSYMDETYTVNRIKSITKNYPEFPKIILVHGHMTDYELSKLYKDSRVKAGIFLTHGEGWGLSIADLAACNKPIIASNWSAHTEFLNLGKWIRIPCDIKESGIENDLFAKGNRWAFPSHEEAVRHLKKMYSNYSMPQQWAIELGAKIRENFNIKVIEDKYYEVFEKYGFLKEAEEKNEVADSIFGKENLEEIVK
jgi:glycosyltransferase involved in cell wall biosynthesis